MTTATLEAVASAEKGSSLGRDAWVRLKKNRMAMFGLWFFVSITAVCFLLPLTGFIADPNATFPELKSLGPFSSAAAADGSTQFYLLGSDNLGRDIFARIVHGGRVSLTVGFIATAVSLLIGVLYGAVAGYVGGKLDSAMMRIVDILYALPFMIVVIILTTFFGNSLFLLFLAIGAVEWLTMSRIVRAQVLSLKNQEFVEAARSLGLTDWQIIFRHIIPNTLGPVIVYTTLTVPAVMRLEAILSFLGLGVQPPNASWGSLVKEGADRMISDPSLLIFPSARVRPLPCSPSISSAMASVMPSTCALPKTDVPPRTHQPENLVPHAQWRRPRGGRRVVYGGGGADGRHRR